MRRVSRRSFVQGALVAGAFPAVSPAAATGDVQSAGTSSHLDEAIRNERIRRAMLSGPGVITSDATVAEMDRLGNTTVLRPGTNEWVCVPGNRSLPDAELDGFVDALARRIASFDRPALAAAIRALQLRADIRRYVTSSQNRWRH
jgi:hypothetical protein